MDAVEEYRQKAHLRFKSITLRELANIYYPLLESGETSGRKSTRPNSTKHVKIAIGRIEKFLTDYSDWLVCNIDEEIIDDWLSNLKVPDKRGRIHPASARTRNNYRAALSGLFTEAVAKKYIDENPFQRIKKWDAFTEPQIFTPAQINALLQHAPDEILPALAIAAFAGVRRAEIERLTWDDIKLSRGEHGVILISRPKAKTKKKRSVPISENLAKWLQPFAALKKPIMPSEQIYRSRLNIAKANAGLESWPTNVLRHSFASYYLERCKSLEETALLMGNSPAMIEEHYKDLVDPDDAKAYWQIAPIEIAKISKIRST
ncbi:tyrosine-type recombinase/integrase [Roseibacillus persicicus]